MSKLLPIFPSKGIPEILMQRVAEFAATISMEEQPSFHIVMLVPMMDTSGVYPDYPIKPHLLAEYTYGDKKTWKGNYAEIAQCKAMQLWHDRNGGGTDSTAHLLFLGDTHYWGGVKRDGIVVACSGVKSWFDRMISGMVADAYIAYAHDEKAAWVAAHPNKDFIS